MLRYIAVCLFGLALLTGSCKKENNQPPVPEGTYTGTFQRIGGPVSNVTLTFSGNSWSGQSDTPQYPAICQGSYSSTIEGDIVFEQDCFWTANFDWSLILNGEFDFTLNGRDIELVKTYASGMRDVYRLTRQ